MSDSRERFLTRDRRAAEIKQLKVTVDTWETFEKLIRSNYGKNNFLYCGHTDSEQNKDIFESLGRLGCINRTQWSDWMEKGVIAWRDKHLLLGICRKKNGGMSYRQLDIVMHYEE